MAQRQMWLIIILSRPAIAHNFCTKIMRNMCVCVCVCVCKLALCLGHSFSTLYMHVHVVSYYLIKVLWLSTNVHIPATFFYYTVHVCILIGKAKLKFPEICTNRK